MPTDLGPDFRVATAFGAAAEALTAAETHFGVDLPADYRNFMSEFDGGEGFVGLNYLVLWRAHELVQFNEEYEFPKYAPSLIAFGGDGGGEAFAFDRRDPSLPITIVNFIGMSDDSAIRVADSFDQLIERLKSGEELF